MAQGGRSTIKPFLDQIPIAVTQVTAQTAPRQSGQIAHSIDKKRRFREVVFLGQLAVQNHGFVAVVVRSSCLVTDTT